MGLDPTDGFLSWTRVYLYGNSVIQIDPAELSSSSSEKTWLTDKARQFFDSIFKSPKHFNLKKHHWVTIFDNLVDALYVQDKDAANKSKKKLTLVFENLSLETLSFLILINSNFSCLKITKSQDFVIKNDLEEQFQLNLIKNNSKWDASTICLLISTNPRFEGVNLNLNLRQRMLKGNFKCIVLGSLSNITFPISFIGSNFNIFKTINAGTNFMCQDLKSAKNPFIVYNPEFLKRSDRNCIETLLKILSVSNIVTKIWNGLNIISATASETGVSLTYKFLPVTKKDLNSFSALYLLNVNLNNLMNLKKITETKLLNFNDYKKIHCRRVIFDQNPHANSNLDIGLRWSKTDACNMETNYQYLPSSTFYENEETFVSTEGNILRTQKIIFKKKTKNGWQILRKLFKRLHKHVTFTSNPKDNDIIFFNSKLINNFRNYINFQFYAAQNLTNTDNRLPKKTKSFFLSNCFTFTLKKIKTYSTKMSYWLNDFFNGGRDEYSYSSLILQDCSSATKLKATNFF